jgi:hypothetical protein
VGEQTISYHSMTKDAFQCLIPEPAIFECYVPTKWDHEVWILGDSEGRIYTLSLEHDLMRLEKIGQVASPRMILRQSLQFPQS